MIEIFSIWFSTFFNTHYFIALKQIYINMFRIPQPLPIHPISQFPRTPKYHNPPRRHHHILAGRWIPSFPLHFTTPIPSNLIQKNTSNFLIINPQIPHCDRWRGVTEPFTQHLKWNAVFCPLDISKSFSQGVDPIISFQRFCPLLDHLMHGFPDQWFIIAVSGLK